MCGMMPVFYTSPPSNVRNAAQNIIYIIIIINFYKLCKLKSKSFPYYKISKKNQWILYNFSSNYRQQK